MARERGYYSTRNGSLEETEVTLEDLRAMLPRWFRGLDEDGCWAEWFQSVGTATEVADHMFRVLGKDNLWPIDSHAAKYTEGDVFDVIEYLFDHASKVVGRRRQGRQVFTTFDRRAGQVEMRSRINPRLARYGAGFTLTGTGEIHRLPDSGMEPLTAAVLPGNTPDDEMTRVDTAIAKFHRHGASLDDMKGAVRDLADVLERLRPELKKVLSRKDDGTLFDVANNFAIRHNNASQKTEYTPEVWYPWMFYFYLATIHAVLALMKKVG